MSVYIDLNMLTDKSNLELLKCVDRVLSSNGIKYNDTQIGEYWYWIDSPIWNYGESYYFKESTTGSGTSIDRVISSVSEFFSPIIIYGYKEAEVVRVVVQIVENSNQPWKELSVSIDRDAVSDQAGRMMWQSLDRIIKTFTELVRLINPFYAFSSVESICKFTSSEDVHITNKGELGSLAYISKDCIPKLDIPMAKLKDSYTFLNSEDDDYLLMLAKNDVFEFY